MSMSPCPCFRLHPTPFLLDRSILYWWPFECLQEAGVPTPKFGLAKSAAEARKIAEDIATNDLVVKAQVSKNLD